MPRDDLADDPPVKSKLVPLDENSLDIDTIKAGMSESEKGEFIKKEIESTKLTPKIIPSPASGTDFSTPPEDSAHYWKNKYNLEVRRADELQRAVNKVSYTNDINRAIQENRFDDAMYRLIELKRMITGIKS